MTRRPLRPVAPPGARLLGALLLLATPGAARAQGGGPPVGGGPPDVSQVSQRVFAYLEAGGPSVLLCGQAQGVFVPGPLRTACHTDWSGGDILVSAPGGVLRAQHAVWATGGGGIGRRDGSTASMLRATGTLSVDLRPSAFLPGSVVSVGASAVFRLHGSLYADATAGASSSAAVAFDASVTALGGAPAQSYAPFRSGCTLFSCFGRWFASAAGAEAATTLLSELRPQPLLLTMGVVNVFELSWAMETWADVTAGADGADAPIAMGRALIGFQNTAGLASLALTGLDATGQEIALPLDGLVRFSDGMGLLPDDAPPIPDLPLPPLGAPGTTVPEPGTWALLATGLAALGLVAPARARRRAAGGRA